MILELAKLKDLACGYWLYKHYKYSVLMTKQFTLNILQKCEKCFHCDWWHMCLLLRACNLNTTLSHIKFVMLLKYKPRTLWKHASMQDLKLQNLIFVRWTFYFVHSNITTNLTLSSTQCLDFQTLLQSAASESICIFNFFRET